LIYTNNHAFIPFDSGLFKKCVVVNTHEKSFYLETEIMLWKYCMDAAEFTYKITANRTEQLFRVYLVIGRNEHAMMNYLS